MRIAISDANTWLGMAFGAVGSAAFKSLEVFYGPYLIDRGISESTIGIFSIFGMSGLMVVGSLIGGRLADRTGARLVTGWSLAFISICVLSLAVLDHLSWAPIVTYALPLLATTAIGIGVFTAASYSLFMDLSQERLGATQFSAFMGSTNGCESWSSYVSGLIIVAAGYPWAMATMALLSLLALPLLVVMRVSPNSQPNRP